MNSLVRQTFDVLVIGGGPAGMAAAARAAEAGMHTAIADDNPDLGGQIWRGASAAGHDAEAASWVSRVNAAGVTRLCGVRVFDQVQPGVLCAESTEAFYELGYRKLILATGARELFLPFPGWTLPNVLGAGGLQAMVKSGLPVKGKRVVVAGSGPLLLAVAVFLRKHGARVLAICEQASWSSLARFGLALLSHPSKLGQAFTIKRELARIPFKTSSWPVSAQGRDKIDSVTIRSSRGLETLACDFLACGFHLVANVELPALLGCQVDNDYVRVNEWQETTVAGIFCAGEPTGIGGLELSLVEGEIAGLAAAGRNGDAKKLFSGRSKMRRFPDDLARAFRLHPELRALTSGETIVCRCEDVTYERLRSHTSWRAAKLHTRCGMGPCQGRICGPASQFLFGWHPESVRPPMFPARLENMAHGSEKSEGAFVE
jgi:D-hydroxyproline dehydrogenase subunit alpha